jgi:hypothetical protein
MMKRIANLLNCLFLRVRFLKLTVILLAVVFLPEVVHGQVDDSQPRRGSRIIDDTTKQVYGPRTSRYFFEEEVFMNRDLHYRVDTVIRDFHRFTDVQRNGNLYQDLGAVGTAIRPIYYEIPDQIGANSGFNSFDVYWNREQIKFWDTKSPYSNMYVILGGRGRSVTRATFSRNINPQWNFGVTYRGIFTDKQISRQGKGDRIVRGQYYDFFTTYQSKDSTYRLFATFRRLNHEVADYGGVRNDVPANFTYQDYFSIDAQPFLTEVINQELRMNLHLFHQYKIGSGLQLYHKFDRYRQSNRFTDKPASEPAYDFVEIDSVETNDKSKFTSMRNEVGIKGSLSKLFYNGYYAIRNYTMEYSNDTIYDVNNASHNLYKGVENYVGGRVSLKLDSLVDVIGWGEIILPGTTEDLGNSVGNYRLEGSIVSKWFEASLKQVQYSPTFMQRFYRGAHDYWDNSGFDNVNTTRLSGSVHYRSKVFALSPGVTFTRVGNYIFFKRIVSPYYADAEEFPDSNPNKTDVYPLQASGENIIFSPNLGLGITMMKHVHFRGNAIFTRMIEETSDRPFDIPELFANGQISYENIFFNGNLDMHAGVDLHWKSPYYGLAYDVPTSQFYIQNKDPEIAGFNDQGGNNFTGIYDGEPRVDGRFQTPSLPNQENLPIVDLFFNAKIKRARVFFRYNNITQLITKTGYFATPQYPGQRNTIDFGFDWSFYD